jgi:hypothetical protein
MQKPQLRTWRWWRDRVMHAHLDLPGFVSFSGPTPQKIAWLRARPLWQTGPVDEAVRQYGQTREWPTLAPDDYEELHFRLRCAHRMCAEELRLHAAKPLQPWPDFWECMLIQFWRDRGLALLTWEATGALPPAPTPGAN